MNYLHTYHAGSFTDVFKHVVLIILLKSLTQKETPCCYFDLHAGRGKYDLFSVEAQKTQEYHTGIQKVVEKIDETTPAIIQYYVSLVKSQGFPANYPGSPLIASLCLRSQDSLVLSELVREQSQPLQSLFAKDSRVAVHTRDAYEALKGLFPPKEKRGLVLIDPPFEQANDWENILKYVPVGLKKFSTGIFAIWYPLKDLKRVDSFVKEIIKLACPKMINATFCIYPPDASFKINGCGMLVLNAPWKFEETLEACLPWLWQTLSVKAQGFYQVEKLS